MYKCIRCGLFETNSSSTHSITIDTSKQKTDLIKPDKDGNIVSFGGKFGWEERVYTSAQKKLDYLVVHLYQKYSSFTGDESKRFNKSLNEMRKDENYQKLSDIILEYCGGHLLVKGNYEKNTWCPLGYIDHASQEEAERAFENKDILAAFLFNPQSELQTSNDN